LLVKRQTQELVSERESRRRLESEVETLCSQERDLKGKAEKQDAALFKVSDSPYHKYNTIPSDNRADD